jgi:transcriptional regulator with XRE-family HTH domain
LQPTGEWLRQPGGLAERLRAMREAAGLTGVALAERAGWSRSRSKVPKLEGGRQMPTENDIRTWCDVCGQPGAVPELLDLLAEARVIHRQYRHRLRGGQAAIQEELAALVAGARLIQNFEVLFVPGLLQTPGYARARMLDAVRNHGFAEDGVDAAVAARMRRQEILYEPGREFVFVIMEVALLVRVCPAAVMLGQLDRLQTIADLPNVTLGIIPLDAELDLAPDVGFMLIDEVAYVETAASEDLLRGEEAETYVRFAGKLLAQAATGETARELITAATRRTRALLS